MNLLNSIAGTKENTTGEPSNDRGVTAAAVVVSTLGVTLLVALTAVIIGVVYYKVQRRKRYVNLLATLHSQYNYLKEYCYTIFYYIHCQYTCSIYRVRLMLFSLHRTLLYHFSGDRHENNLKTNSLVFNSAYARYQRRVSNARTLPCIFVSFFPCRLPAAE